MKSILIATDFSEAATHAVQYGYFFAKQHKTERIILFYSHPIIVSTTDTSIIAYDALSDSVNFREEYVKQLENLRDSLKDITGTTIKVDLIVEESVSLPDVINMVCKREHIDLVIMGIKGKTNLERILIGSNAIKVSEESNYPALMVPKDAQIQPIKNILFATDLDKISETVPTIALDKFLNLSDIKLHVLNVDDKDKHFSPKTPIEISFLHELLDKYEPAYHFISKDDIVQSILDFSNSTGIDLIIVISKKYGLFESLFHKSISHKLVYHTSVPLLCIRSSH